MHSYILKHLNDCIRLYECIGAEYTLLLIFASIICIYKTIVQFVA
nr:MAG TPA: hypothetical protein [Caudoviricetes sp.]